MPLSLYLRGPFPACSTFVLSRTALLQQHSIANWGLCHPPLTNPTGTADCRVVWEFHPTLASGLGLGLAGTLFTLKVTKIKMTEVEPLCQHLAETNIKKQHLSSYWEIISHKKLGTSLQPQSQINWNNHQGDTFDQEIQEFFADISMTILTHPPASLRCFFQSLSGISPEPGPGFYSCTNTTIAETDIFWLFPKKEKGYVSCISVQASCVPPSWELPPRTESRFFCCAEKWNFERQRYRRWNL